MITINNGVTNVKQTPGIITDVFSNRPTVTETGVIFISTDTGEIYTFDGIAWIQLGGGGGGGGIDTVLAINQLLSANRVIDLNGFNLSTIDTNTGDNLGFSIDTSTTDTYFGMYSGGNGTYLRIKDQTQIISSYLNNIPNGIYLENNVECKFGWLDITQYSANITINKNNRQTGFNVCDGANYYPAYLHFDSLFNYGFIGDLNGNGNSSGTINYIYFDFGSNVINTKINNADNGFQCTQFISRFGQFDATNFCMFEIDAGTGLAHINYGGNKVGFEFDLAGNIFYIGSQVATTCFQIDAGTSYIMWNSTDYPRFDDNGSGNMISATAGGSSGFHMNIKINGADYKIALLNP